MALMESVIKRENKMKILTNDLKRQYDLYANDYEQKAIDILRSGWYILGKEVSAFEEEFAKYTGANYCVGLGNGLDALWISFKLLGIKEGDEVIVCSNAYIACVMGITMNRATPVFVEPDEYDNIDAKKIEQRITKNTKAILAVHLYGQSCDMDIIMDLAKKHKLRVVEDCAQSHGTKWKDKTCGTIGDVGCFSFYPSKGCGAFGDAGAIITNSKELADKFKIYRNYGSEKRYYNQVVGTNSRLDEMQAGLLRVKLSHLDEMNTERNILANRYISKINNPVIKILTTRPNCYNTWHQFVIHTSYRDQLIEYLNDYEIGTIIHYPIPPHLAEAYEYLGFTKGDFPIAEKYSNEVLSLPIYNGMTEEEQDFVIEKINDFKLDFKEN